MTKTVERSTKEPSSAAEKIKVKYRLSKAKIFLLCLVLATMCVIGGFVIKANRDIVGHWHYVGKEDFFSGELPKEDAEKQTAKKVKIIITEKTIELVLGSDSLGKTEYKMEGGTLIGTDSVTRLDIDWNGFSPTFSGTLFEKKGVIDSVERKQSPDLAVKNILFIIGFSVLGLFLLMVASMESIKPTFVDEKSKTPNGRSTRSAIGRSDVKKDAFIGTMISGERTAPTEKVVRRAVSKSAMHSAFKQGTDIELSGSDYIERGKAFTAADNSLQRRETIGADGSRKLTSNVFGGREKTAEKGYFGNLSKENAEASKTGNQEKRGNWFKTADDL